jgi:hypothetical protein
MATPAVARPELTGTELEQFGLTVGFFADPEDRVVDLSKGAVQ